MLPNEIMEIILKKAGPPTMLSFRVSCKEYKKLITAHLEKPSQCSAWFPYLVLDLEELLRRKVGTVFPNGDKMDEFVSTMSRMNTCSEPKDYNPFPTRHIKVTNLEENSFYSQLKFATSFENLASTFGHNVWSCTYYTDCHQYHFMVSVKKLLQNLPNLRNLTLIQIAAEEVPRGSGGRRLITPDDLWKPSVPEYFPTHKHLIALNVVGCSQRGFLKTLFHSYANQIQSLECNGVGAETFSDILCFPGINGALLEDIRIESVDNRELERLLLNPKTNSYKLKRLAIVTLSQGKLFPSIVIRLLNTFATSLEEFYLDVEGDEISDARNRVGGLAEVKKAEDYSRLRKVSTAFSVARNIVLGIILENAKSLKYLELLNYQKKYPEPASSESGSAERDKELDDTFGELWNKAESLQVIYVYKRHDPNGDGELVRESVRDRARE